MMVIRLTNAPGRQVPSESIARKVGRLAKLNYQRNEHFISMCGSGVIAYPWNESKDEEYDAQDQDRDSRSDQRLCAIAVKVLCP